MSSAKGVSKGFAPAHRAVDTLASSNNTHRALGSESDSDSEDSQGDDFALMGPDGDEAYELQDMGRHGKQSSGQQPPLAEEDDDADEDDDEFVSRVRSSRRLSSSTAASFQLYTPDEEQAVVRKFDRRLVLFLSVCYMMSFLDRSSMSLEQGRHGSLCFSYRIKGF